MEEFNMKHEEVSLDRLPPQDIEAEQSVLGSMILDSNSIRTAKEIVSAEDFYKTSSRKIFSAILELAEEEKEVDLITLRDKLLSKGELDEVGGSSYISSLCDIPTAANVKYHAKIVKEKAMLRAIIRAAMQTGQNVYDGAMDSSLVLHEAFNALDKVAEKSKSNEIGRLNVGSGELLERASYFRETPFDELNDLIGGFSSESLIIIGGRTGMGKTSLMMSLLRKIALEEKLPSVYIGSSNHGEELTALRLLADPCKINYNDLKRGRVGVAKMKSLEKMQKRICDKIFMKFGSRINVLSAISGIRSKQKEVGKLGLVVIENIQDLSWPQKTKDDTEEMNKVLDALRDFTGKIKTPVIVSSQINRKAEDGEDCRPKLSHLKNSGKIEDVADGVLLLHREAYFKRNLQKGQTEVGEIIIAKGGPPTTVLLEFWGKYYAWKNPQKSTH
jgi:replicative DNA helicase